MTTEPVPDEQEEERHKDMIRQECQRFDLAIQEDEWRRDEDEGRITARLGRWRVIETDEERGLYEDEEGELHAVVVGGVEYGNERAKFYFVADGTEGGGMEAVPWDDIEYMS